jgi:DEAD/DEAH box helicase domain-containing protein
MYPSILAAQMRATLIDYLKTTFSFSEREFEEEFFDFLNGPKGIMRGPYLDVRLPFRTSHDARHPLVIKPPFAPYEHQRKAFARLHSRDGHQPQPTLVVTGTGSGKTECFLYPVLDHCYRTRNEPGIKAILLYPMNALATDQARRLAEMLWNDERLKGVVSAGLYVGGQGQHHLASEQHLVDERNVLRKSPPNILLTNYKMLDFLLQRPEDKTLWSRNTPASLKYLVLDELHTYDGAQGSDVACLIRRLRSRLQVPPGGMCCVGTSATIGADTRQTQGENPLVDFARDVFGEPNFYDDSIVGEDRVSIEAFLGRGQTTDSDRVAEAPPKMPVLPKFESELSDSVTEYIEHQAEYWLEISQPDPVKVGEKLKTHRVLRYLLQALEGGPEDVQEVGEYLARFDDRFKELPEEKRVAALSSFVALISYARVREGNRLRPFLTCHVYFWFRELRKLQRKISKDIKFFWSEDTPNDNSYHGLPIAYCRECGVDGVGTKVKPGTDAFISSQSEIGDAFLNQNKHARFILLDQHRQDGQFPYFLDTNSLRYSYKNEADEGEIPIAMTLDSTSTGGGSQTKKFLGECPNCGAEDSISLLGSRAATLSSVAISLLFNSPYNEDKKLLAFTDSVQDASHRSGFFAARTYRFHLRTQLQRIVQQNKGELPLADCCDALIKQAEKAGSNAVVSFWPSDLEYHEAYQKYLKSGDMKDIREELASRLSWEICMEYGYSARVGRTLEKTGCSTVFLNPRALERSAVSLSQDLKEKKMITARRKEPSEIRHFLSAFLHRLRVRGGVYHPMLNQYVAENGEGYHLSKRRKPLISPFPPGTRQPKFLHSDNSHKVFDVFRSNTRHWYRDWASRALGMPLKDQGLPDLYRQVLLRLKENGLIVSLGAGKGTAYGLPLSALTISSDLAAVRCKDCQQTTTLEREEAKRWVGKRCVKYRCEGLLEEADLPETYYSRIYGSGHTTRVTAHEHTGLLQREVRENVEERFKNGGPGDPNLLVCTPTLELGVDVGDLSATMVCSVPPGPANFVQRMGRAGRATGNAFCLSVTLQRPHDLYFFAQPMEMMAGVVQPPACFLNAPEMLKRQMVAFALDTWAREETEKLSIPIHSSFILNNKNAPFPYRAIEYYRKNREVLTKQFLTLFKSHLDDDNYKILKEFGLSDAVPQWLSGAFEALGDKVKELKSQSKTIAYRQKKLEQAPDEYDDPDEEKRQLEDSRRIISRLISELQKKYPLNTLTDEGVLPNYAFPEPGVTLRSVVRLRKDGPVESRYETKEYLRAASSAIKEFAPFARFYADGRKVRVKQVDVGSKSQPLVERWRFCPDCNYMERLHQEQSELCPRCGCVGFADTGQERNLIPFRRASAFSTPLDTIAVDETDDRKFTSYTTYNLVDIAEKNYYSAHVIESQAFGYELLKEVTLREVNFGKKESGQAEFYVAGHKVNEEGFVVCEECGSCEEIDRRKQSRIDHQPHCKYRRSKLKAKTIPVMLYRQVTSEAIRILLPIVTYQVDSARASFKAALQLGLRCHFGGEPAHLTIRQVSEPIPGDSENRRNYLILYDAVPGGTGYLADLCKGSNFLDVLEKAVKHFTACRCVSEGLDGCYRCLYGYQVSYDLPLISRRKALELLEPILEDRADLKKIQTLSDVPLERKEESELELRFVEALKRFCDENKDYQMVETAHGGQCWNMSLPSGLSWRLKSQKTISVQDGVTYTTRPDFVLENTTGAPEAPQVAIYLDGFKYHACPDQQESRLVDDFKKRQSLINEKYVVWSLTWADVKNFDERETGKNLSFLDSSLAKKIAAFCSAQLPEFRAGVCFENPVMQLLALLDNPGKAQWVSYVQGLLALHVVQKPQYTSDDIHGFEEGLDFGEVLPKLPDTAQKSDERLAYLQRSRFAGFSASVALEDLGQQNLEKIRTKLTLRDDWPSRSEQDYKRSWQTVLTTWNLLQFHLNAEISCHNAVQKEAEPKEVIAAPPEPEPPKVELPDWYEWLDDACRVFLAAMEQGELPLAKCGYELMANGRVIVETEAELAWPEQKIAVVLEEDVREEYVAVGWKAFLPEQLDDVKEELKVG